MRTLPLLAVWLTTSGFSPFDTGTLDDDFESGVLLTPNGAWTQRTISGADPVDSSMSAAHRGLWGLRVTDTNPQTSSGLEGHVRSTGPASAGPSFYLRGWMRVVGGFPMGSNAVAFAGFGLREFVGLYIGGTGLSLAGVHSDGGFSFNVAPARVADGGWQLIELASEGFGTEVGRNRLWVNGQLANTVGPFGWSGMYVDAVTVGEFFCDNRSFTGTLDFDDVRSGTEPLASRITITGAPLGGVCSPITIGLANSVDGGAAPAPRMLNVQLAFFGNIAGGWFGDPGCGAASSIATIASGATSGATWFRADSYGDLRLIATETDFLAGRLDTVVSDGGSGGGSGGGNGGGSGGGNGGGSGGGNGGANGGGSGGTTPAVLGVGCGCGASGWSSALLAAVLLCVRRTAAHRKTPPSPLPSPLRGRGSALSRPSAAGA